MDDTTPAPQPDTSTPDSGNPVPGGYIEPPPPPADYQLPPSLEHHEDLTEARLNGYSWPEIRDHLQGQTNEAYAAGYTDREIDDHRGFPDPGALQTDLALHWTQELAADPQRLDELSAAPRAFLAPLDALSAGRIADYAGLTAPREIPLAVNPTETPIAVSPTEVPLGMAEPPKRVAPINLYTDQTRSQYADALLNGYAKSPLDFAERTAGAFWRAAVSVDPTLYDHGGVITGAAKSLADTLPSNEELTDYAVGLAHQEGAPLAPDAVARIKANIADTWTDSGNGSMMDVYRAANISPVLADQLVSPKSGVPEPTMAEFQAALRNTNPALFQKGKDAIYDPMGNMFTDPTGLVSTAKAVYNLPEDQAAWRDRLAKAKQEGATPEQIKAIEDENPALNLLGTFVMGTLAGKLGGVAARGVGKVAGEINGDTLAQLWADERGTIDFPIPREKPANLDAALAALGRAEPRRPVEPSVKPPELVNEKAIVSPLEDDLNRLRTNAVADKIVLTQMVDALPKEYLDPAFQERVSAAVEQRLIDPTVQHPADVKGLLDAVKPLTDRQFELGQEIAAKTRGLEIDDPALGIRSVDEGYVHRVAQGGPIPSPLDPNVERGDIVTGSRPSTLSKFAPGMQQRIMYVLDDGNGTRLWGDRPLDTLRSPVDPQRTARMGDTIATGDQTWTFKPATMAEVEANTDVRYNKNFLANTVENIARLERVNRNLDFLANQAKELEQAGLFVRRGAETPIAPPGMKRVELPQLDGFATPRIADVLNDFFGGNRGNLEWSLTRANRFLMSSLFISPVVHAGNVAAHWAVGRGWEWVRPRGYGSLISDGARAVREVWTQGPRYVEHLREGSGLLYGSTTTDNFYTAMMHKLFHEQLADEPTWRPYAKSLGFKAVADLVKAEYAWSRRSLWAVNDMFLLQRQFELERRGLPMRDAIYEAERDIPNYRIPSRVMGSRAMSEFLQSPNYINFGRYKYGQIRAIADVVRSLIRPGADVAERMEAAGKATVMAALAVGGYPLLNSGLQYVTNNPNASVRAFGPFSLIDAAGGFFAGQKNWVSALASFATLAPVLQMARMLTTNTDVWGRKIIEGSATTTGKIVEGLEAAASQFYPAQLLQTALKPGGMPDALGSLVGLKLAPPHDPNAAAKWAKRDAALAYSRERKDVFEQAINNLLGLTLPPAAHRGGGGRRRSAWFSGHSGSAGSDWFSGATAGASGGGGGQSARNWFNQ